MQGRSCIVSRSAVLLAMKRFNRYSLTLLLCLAIFVGPSAQTYTEPGKMKNEKYKAGQVWSYSTRKGEEHSRLFIVRVDRHEKLGSIYHIFLDGLSVSNPHIEGGIQDILPHSPVSQQTLDASVKSLVTAKADALPDIAEGYEVWKEAFDKNEAGVFIIPVQEIIQITEDAVLGKAGNS